MTSLFHHNFFIYQTDPNISGKQGPLFSPSQLLGDIYPFGLSNSAWLNGVGNNMFDTKLPDLSSSALHNLGSFPPATSFPHSQLPISESLGMLPSLYASVQRTTAAHANQINCPDDPTPVNGNWLAGSRQPLTSASVRLNSQNVDKSADNTPELSSTLEQATGSLEEISVRRSKTKEDMDAAAAASQQTPSSEGMATGNSHSINNTVHNTLRKTKSDMKVVHRYLVQVKDDTRETHQIPPCELDRYIQVG